MMDILRQRLFISHDSKSQRSITSEYTIRSRRDNLTNLIFISKNVLPNLIIHDDKDNVLPVMPTTSVKQLLQFFLTQSNESQKEKLEFLMSEIDNGGLHLIWIKIPKHRSLQKNEVRSIILNYSPKYNNHQNSVLRLKIKKQKYPLYYTLFTPYEFDFKQTSYVILSKGQIKSSYDKPNNVEKIKTHNSDIFRITSKADTDFAILYSFRPSSEATFSTKFGVGVLIGLFSAVSLIRFFDLFENYTLIQNQTQIALFIIGGSLLLPQLTGNNFIRRAQIKYYLIPVVLGIILLIWGITLPVSPGLDI